MSPITATWPAAELEAAAPSDGTPRTIRGLAVPWNVAGTVADGTSVVFHAGALDPAGRPVALRDHDRTRPIGRVTDAADTGAGLAATITVSRVPAGDDALILAADGALPMLSVGANPTEYQYAADGTLHVHAAEWLELSLLTIGAYPSARVADVTAQSGGPMAVTEMTDTPAEDDDAPAPAPAEDDDDDATPPDTVEAGARPVPLTAAASSSRTPGRHPFASVGIDQMAALICAARGDRRSLEYAQRVLYSPGARMPSIMAALSDVTLVGTDNVGAMYRPAYQAELVEIVSHGTPAINAIRSGDLVRGDYPTKSFLTWSKPPEVELQTAEKQPIYSAPVAITPASCPVQSWAGGNDVSAQLLDLGHPSFIAEYVRAAGADYGAKTNAYVSAALLAAATAVATAVGDSLVDVIGKLYAGLNPATTPAGPMFLLGSWDLVAGAAGLQGTDNAPVFWNGSISLDGTVPEVNAGGMVVVADASLPARTAILGSRQAATWYAPTGVPYQLEAVNVSLLGRDLGVYGYGALGVQYPGALVKTTVPLV